MLENIPKQQIIDELKKSTSFSECLIKLGITKRNHHCRKWIKMFAKEHNVSIIHMRGKKSLMNRLSKEDLIIIVNKSICWMDVVRGTGRSFHGSYVKMLRTLTEYYEIDTSHFDTKKALSINNYNKKSSEEMFCKNSTVSQGSIKTKIVRDNLIPYVCVLCENDGNHNKQPLTLQLDHINGVRNDNRLENLRFLCPNCHSQTKTFTGKNAVKYKIDVNTDILDSRIRMREEVESYKQYRKVNRPTKEVLQKLLWQQPTVKIAKHFGVSDVAVKKWAKMYKLDWPGRGYWQKNEINCVDINL